MNDWYQLTVAVVVMQQRAQESDLSWSAVLVVLQHVVVGQETIGGETIGRHRRLCGEGGRKSN